MIFVFKFYFLIFKIGVVAKRLTNKKLDSSFKSVLIIDDDASIRMLLEIMLKQQYQVVTVENGYDALFWLENNDIPDLIIADINMPRINGIKFINHIKKSGYYRNIPILVLSGSYDSDNKAQCINAGVSEFMVKPFNPAELSDKINDVISGRQSIKYA